MSCELLKLVLNQKSFRTLVKKLEHLLIGVRFFGIRTSNFLLLSIKICCVYFQLLFDCVFTVFLGPDLVCSSGLLYLIFGVLLEKIVADVAFLGRERFKHDN